MKLLRKLMALIVILILGCMAVIIYKGYEEYNQIVDQVAVEEKVEDIRSEESYINTNDISSNFLNAIVSVEDRRFKEHGGVDYIGLLRAVIYNITNKEFAQGGSTITQQLAKNMYFEYNSGVERKLPEMFIARYLEKKYSKEEILEMYVNIIYYGDGNYGINQASINYFGNKPSQLSLAEGSMLAGLPQAPSAYALSTNIQLAKSRQKMVLSSMVDNDIITKEELEEASQTTLNIIK